MRALARPFLSATEAMTLGMLEGERQQISGTIRDIDIDHSQAIYILDSQLKEVRVYSKEGEYLNTIGGPGEGPNEFEAPLLLQIDPAGRRIIVTESNRGVRIFAATDDDYAYAWTATIPLTFSPKGMCVLDGAVFVQGASPTHVQEADLGASIHRYSLSGEPIGSFGDEYKPSGELVRYYCSSGPVVCVREPEGVVFFPELLPTMYGYSHTGDL